MISLSSEAKDMFENGSITKIELIWKLMLRGIEKNVNLVYVAGDNHKDENDHSNMRFKRCYTLVPWSRKCPGEYEKKVIQKSLEYLESNNCMDYVITDTLLPIVEKAWIEYKNEPPLGRIEDILAYMVLTAQTARVKSEIYKCALGLFGDSSLSFLRFYQAVLCNHPDKKISCSLSNKRKRRSSERVRSPPTGLRRIIDAFYNQKKNMVDFLTEASTVAKTSTEFRPSHASLLHDTHLAPTSPGAILIFQFFKTYCKGDNQRRKAAESLRQFVESKDPENLQLTNRTNQNLKCTFPKEVTEDVIEICKRMEVLLEIKRTDKYLTKEELLEYLTKNPWLRKEHIPSFYLRKKEIVSLILRRLQVKELLYALSSLTVHGNLKDPGIEHIDSDLKDFDLGEREPKMLKRAKDELMSTSDLGESRKSTLPSSPQEEEDSIDSIKAFYNASNVTFLAKNELEKEIKEANLENLESKYDTEEETVGSSGMESLDSLAASENEKKAEGSLDTDVVYIIDTLREALQNGEVEGMMPEEILLHYLQFKLERGKMGKVNEEMKKLKFPTSFHHSNQISLALSRLYHGALKGCKPANKTFLFGLDLHTSLLETKLYKCKPMSGLDAVKSLLLRAIYLEQRVRVCGNNLIQFCLIKRYF